MLTNEKALTFKQAADLLPRINGKKVHTSALWRWATRGVREVKLEALLLGGRYVTSAEAIERFGKALAATVAPGTPPPSKLRPGRSRLKAVTKAREDLERAGI